MDFLTLLKTKNDEGNKNKKIPAISVIESLENNKSIEELDNSDSEEEVEIDWEFPQTLPGASAASVLLNSHPFGFSLQQTDYFNDLRDVILLIHNFIQFIIFFQFFTLHILIQIYTIFNNYF